MDSGFSLLELLVVLVIMAIFASIAYPTYQNTIIRARRTDAQMALMELANRMEQYYADHQTYQHATIGTGQLTDVSSHLNSPEDWYHFTITHLSDTSYTLKAIPRLSQATTDTDCQSFTLTHLATKGIAEGPMGHPKSTAAHCWLNR